MEFRKHGDRTKLYRYLPDERRRCMLAAKMTALYNSLPQEEQQALHQRVMAEMQAWR